MKRFLCLFILCLGNLAYAQQDVQGIATGQPQADPEIKRGWNLHTNYSYAVIDNHYEVQRQHKSGIGVGLNYRVNRWFAFEGVFTRYQRHEALGLVDIQAWTLDCNGQLTLRIVGSDLYFRMLSGIGYVNWKGTYIGPNFQDIYHWRYGKILHDHFGTFNLGCGFAHYFMRQRLEGYTDLRLRFGPDTREVFSICDVQIQVGLRYYIGTMRHNSGSDNGSSAGNAANDKDGNAKRKTNREKHRRVYKWMKDR